jgi:hypothetical protein
MRTLIILFALIPAIWEPLRAQANGRVESPRFEVSANPAELSLGQSLEVTFTWKHTATGTFLPPDWEAAGLAVLGTSQSTSRSIQNGGRQQVSQVYSFRIMPLQSGELSIPPTIMKAGEAEYKTGQLSIRVSPGAHGDTVLPNPNKPKKPGKASQVPTIRI